MSRMVKVFLGSAKENLVPLQSIAGLLREEGLSVTLWNELKAPASSFFLDDLIQNITSFDFGLFLFGREDVLTSRGVAHDAPRDNVIFEAGLFMGRLGRSRTFVVTPAAGDRPLKVMTDLAGIQLVKYEQPSDPSQLAPVLRSASRELAAQMKKIGPAPTSGVTEGPRGVRAATNMLLRELVHEPRETERPLVVRNIALDMELTWPFLKEAILDDRDISHVHWRSLMIDPASRAIAQLQSLNLSTDQARSNIEDIRRTCEPMRNKLNRRRIGFACRTYGGVPTIHGFLVGEKALLFSVCGRAEGGKLDARLNPYCIFRWTGDGGTADHFISMFRGWFDYHWRAGRHVWPR